MEHQQPNNLNLWWSHGGVGNLQSKVALLGELDSVWHHIMHAHGAMSHKGYLEHPIWYKQQQKERLPFPAVGVGFGKSPSM